MRSAKNSRAAYASTISSREGVCAGLIVLALVLAPVVVASAAEAESSENTLSAHAKEFGEAVKRDTRVVGAAIKEGAHRVAVGAKAVAHEIATAAKRSAAATRAAAKGERVNTPT